jgi:polar amino acid transport system substrate-binding protein
MKVITKLLCTTALMIGALLLADVAFAQQDNLLDVIKKRGKLQVGFSSFLPWAIRDKQGNWVGFEIDVATKLAKDMGVELEKWLNRGNKDRTRPIRVVFIPTSRARLMSDLTEGRGDIAAAGLSITPERQAMVSFAAPFADDVSEIVVPWKSPVVSFPFRARDTRSSNALTYS